MAGVKGRSGRRKSLDSLIKQSAYPVEVWQKFLGDRIHDNWDAIADEYIKRALSKSDVLLLDIVNRMAGKVKDQTELSVKQELTADQIACLAEQVRQEMMGKLPLNTANVQNSSIVEGEVIGGEMSNNTANDDIPF
jgi:hypothetical protein